MKALCLFSGGKDSTVALTWAVNKYEEVVALSFDYPRRPRGEVLAAKRIAGILDVRSVVIDLPFLLWAMDVASVPDGPPQTEAAYVPMRNLIFHSIALSIAESERASSVVAGHIKSDGKAYLDAKADYLTSLYALASSGTYAFGRKGAARIEVVLPLAALSDAEVIEMGRELKAPVSESWSCLVNGEAPCGLCVSCRDRANAIC